MKETGVCFFKDELQIQVDSSTTVNRREAAPLLVTDEEFKGGKTLIIKKSLPETQLLQWANHRTFHKLVLLALESQISRTNKVTDFSVK